MASAARETAMIITICRSIPNTLARAGGITFPDELLAMLFQSGITNLPAAGITFLPACDVKSACDVIKT